VKRCGFDDDFSGRVRESCSRGVRTGSIDMPMQESTLSICRAISSSTWSDALDRLRIAGVTRGLAWRSGAGSFAGRATTVSEEAAALGACALEDFDIGRVLHAAGAGEVLVIDLGGAEISTFGGLAATAARARRRRSRAAPRPSW